MRYLAQKAKVVAARNGRIIAIDSNQVSRFGTDLAEGKTHMAPLTLSFDQPLVLALVAVLAGIAGFVRGFTGFGGPAIMIVVLTYFFSPATVLAKVLLMDMVANIKLVANILPEVDWRRTLTLASATLLGAPFGLWALVYVNDVLMQQFIALLALAASTLLLSGWRLKRPPNLALMLTVGFFAGVIMTATGIALLMMAFLFSGPDSTGRSRANAIAWMFGISICMLSTYAWAEFLTWSDTWRSLLVGIAYLAGATAGARAFVASAEATVRRAAVWLLFVLALLAVAL
jgi:uncharacterized protein